MTEVKRLMPARIYLGEHAQSTISFPLFRHRNAKNGTPEANNIFGYREVMGFFLPSWQRGSVWIESQKIALIESAWRGINIGTFTYNVAAIGSPYDNLLIDGQQRLLALQDYIEDKFPVYGYHYSEVTDVDRRMFEISTHFSSYCTNSEDEQFLRDYYNLMNFGGTAHTEGERA
jgi:hypothetical protein